MLLELTSFCSIPCNRMIFTGTAEQLGDTEPLANELFELTEHKIFIKPRDPNATICGYI